MKRDLTLELKQLRLHGMAGAWSDLVEQGTNAGLDSSRWLLEHLLQAEETDLALRSVSHQMHAARFPVHRDVAGFDFEVSPVDRKLVNTIPLGSQRILHRSIPLDECHSSSTAENFSAKRDRCAQIELL